MYFKNAFINTVIIVYVVAVVVAQQMATIKMCSRDDCPPNNTKPDVTTKCANCNNLVHLPCIGILLKASQISSPNIKVLCNKCVDDVSDGNLASDLNTSFSATTSKNTPQKKRISNEAVMNEMKVLRNVLEANGQKLKDIAEKTTEIHNRTDMWIEVRKKSNVSKTQMSFNTPTTTKGMNSVPRPMNFASAVRDNFAPPSAKRSRPEKTPNKIKYNAPPPKVGTKTTFAGLSVVSKPKRAELQKFTKYIWVSRLKPETSEDEMIDYIVKNTSANDNTKFRVHKLVKKDADLSALKFVSFKIDVNENEFNTLCDPDVWPENIMVREFIINKTLGEYMFPTLNTSKNVPQSTESMDTLDSHPKSPQPRLSPTKN